MYDDGGLGEREAQARRALYGPPRFEGIRFDTGKLAAELAGVLSDGKGVGNPSVFGGEPSGSFTAEPLPPVRKVGGWVRMSDEQAMDYGLIPDTREHLPLPAPTRRERLHAWMTARRLSLGKRVGSWLAGERLYDDEEAYDREH